MARKAEAADDTGNALCPEVADGLVPEIDVAAWLAAALQGKGGEHVRLAPVDPVRAASLLHSIQGTKHDPNNETAQSFFAALNYAAATVCAEDQDET